MEREKFLDAAELRVQCRCYNIDDIALALRGSLRRRPCADRNDERCSLPDRRPGNWPVVIICIHPSLIRRSPPQPLRSSLVFFLPRTQPRVIFLYAARVRENCSISGRSVRD